MFCFSYIGSTSLYMYKSRSSKLGKVRHEANTRPGKHIYIKMNKEDKEMILKRPRDEERSQE
jgi:hypothetical protein